MYLSKTIRVTFTTLLGLTGVVLAMGANAHEFTSKTISVSHPWARATPPGARTGAAYLEIRASKAGGDTLVGASADELAGRVEIHTHEHDNGVMRMRQLQELPVKADTSIVFGPGGLHLMLLDLKKPLEESDLVKLTLQFKKAGPIEIEATVEPIGAQGPHGMDHQPGHDPQPQGNSHSEPHKH